jgi:hypothetical protein
MKTLTTKLAFSSLSLLLATSAFADDPFPPIHRNETSVHDAPKGTYPHKEFIPLQNVLLDNVSLAGDALVLADGSQWQIAPAGSLEVRNWEFEDILTVSPNYTPFGSYNYWIKNLRTEASVEVNFLVGPNEFSKNSHWVTQVDAPFGIIYIENRIGFEVDPRDRWLSEEWEPNDTVIIGTSNVWFGPYEYMLLNTTLNHYVRAKLF